MHTVLPFPPAQSGVLYLRKEVEIRDSGSRHPLCSKKGSTSKAKWSQQDAKASWSRKDPKWPLCLGLNLSANLPLQPHFPASHNWPQLPAFWAGMALWCRANYLQTLLDPIINPYLGPPSWLYPVTLL